MKTIGKAAALGLVGLAALDVTGCNRGGGNGVTTVVQQPAASSGVGATSSTSSAAGIAPINDQKELCHQVLQKTRGLNNAVIAFWHIATAPGEWSYADPVTSDAVSRVEKESEQVFPALNNIVGKEAPAEAVNVVNEYLKAIKIFSDVIIEQQKNESLNPAASNFGHAKDKLQEICGTGG